MKNNKKRKCGFTLLEVIVSMVIISIISVSVYTGYLIMINETKNGEIKQVTALEGKKVIESLQANNFKIQNTAITVDSMNFNKNGSQFIRYLNNEYKDKQDNGDSVTEDTAKYIESIALTPTKVINSIDSTTNSLKLGSDSTDLENNKIYIGKNTYNKDYVRYSSNGSDKEIPIYSNNGKKKIDLSIYLIPKDSNTEYVEVLDIKGNSLVNFTKDINKNLIINFDNYKEDDGTLPNDTEIEIYMYNKTSITSNLYLEKPKALDVDIETSKGELNIYNSDSSSNANLGTLYDIKVEIHDKNDGKILFTGYYKKNIQQ